MKLEEKELLCVAIEEYDTYPKNCKSVLKCIIEISVDNVAIVKVSSLAKLTGFSRTLIYRHLKLLEKDGALEISNNPGETLSYFKVNSLQMQKILESYKNKRKIIENKLRK